MKLALEKQYQAERRRRLIATPEGRAEAGRQQSGRPRSRERSRHSRHSQMMPKGRMPTPPQHSPRSAAGASPRSALKGSVAPPVSPSPTRKLTWQDAEKQGVQS